MEAAWGNSSRCPTLIAMRAKSSDPYAVLKKPSQVNGGFYDNIY